MKLETLKRTGKRLVTRTSGKADKIVLLLKKP